MLVFFIKVLCFIIFETCSVDRPSPTFSAQFICSLFSDFTPEQTNFCMKYPQETAMISSGIENGLRECEEQFKNQRWNCTLTYPDSGLASFGQNRAIRKFFIHWLLLLYYKFNLVNNTSLLAINVFY